MESQRFLLGQEKMVMMGVHARDISNNINSSQRFMHVMSGEMVSMFATGAYLISLLSTVTL